MEIKMPKLGESVHEGTIEQWLVQVGDTVEEYDPLCEVITDKVTAEVPSSYAGKITKINVEAGETISIGTVICEMAVEGNDTAQEDTAHSKEQTPTQTEPSSSTNQGHSASENQSKNNGRYSPVVFKIASQHHVNLEDVPGTGFEGRVTKKDIEAYIASGESQTTSSQKATRTESNSQAASVSQSSAKSQISSDVHASVIPVKGVRKQIANKMVQSVQEIPHAWMKMEVDATELTKTRNHYKASFKAKEGYNLTFFAFFVKAVAEALHEYPMLNSSWENDEIHVHKEINLSIAVAVEDKLFVPVIKNADEKSIKGIAKEIATLAKKARQNQLTNEDMQGGTFTVNNTGSFGSVSSMGIINHPQAAILQVESIVKRPVVINDMIAIRDMVNLCLSIDHRILDGLQAGQFLNEVKSRIERYTLEHTQIY
ncbi:dihydrolipoamide acetyltransferase family protein [Staphylococcus agnetis]|uniref:dihydrolipoamide acetyltransferase family protein n=1 Tax=Staphylococcus agnetis TaxID=985762 RepID=UPI0004E45A12|nr:dihydrolipoamide acetyltransferase family protein [Staphylococcus agnetis]KFE40906.1 branched-chain alpha-keto aciddehydrogenase complex lipoamide acyltransferase subunit [Staphylococcus agnetis]NJH64822.1 2-oxo acid dehydrogenase subunit E2 [Staphylococcus agnetis]NJH97829.1 2-oxo acid dehydrogenase subunit E2 [Staphylococcus agnetis]PTH46534.1 2-oxo acid dehydrogenase subunit E2 [Staphylococcus agnetis]PTH72377.1 2-oxo acid dehydrogenase subunit E2 [Staphylococcus agnetis]